MKMQNPNSSKRLFMLGNDACAAGAIVAGVRFFAGYPITPSTEIAEYMAKELPKVEGICIQMEDELASIGAVIGASVAGNKAMTATSGAGFSLMQEFISYAAATEIPCVIVNIMRGGPGGGSATQPAQADVMQSRWGTHGDRPAIVLSAATVPEMFFLTIKAVNLSERFRLPVILLSDESIGHLRERVEVPDPKELEIINRQKPEVSVEKFEPLKADPNEIPPMAVMGEGYRVKGYCRLVRDFKGDPTSDRQTQEYLMRRLQNKVKSHLEEIQFSEETYMEDADVVIFVHGSMARPAYRAAKLARDVGIKAGVFKATTIFPFPKKRIEEISKKIKAIIVPELNFGQIINEVESACRKSISVIGMQKIDGDLITAEEILLKVKEVK